ncbi:MAG: hypothetical protein ABL921_27535 [Pirellula sp.]
MNQWKTNATAALCCMGWVAFCGCIPSQPTGTVSGKATYKGAPVPEGCLISFVSDSGFAALGTADASGNYKLVMAGKANVPVAKYHVTVTVPGVQGPVMDDEDERKFMAGDPATVAKFSQKQQKPTIPEKYSDANKSGLSFEIKAGANTYDIVLQ